MNIPTPEQVSIYTHEDKRILFMLVMLVRWSDLWSTDPVSDGRQGVSAVVGEIAVSVVRTGLVVVVRVMSTPHGK